VFVVLLLWSLWWWCVVCVMVVGLEGVGICEVVTVTAWKYVEGVGRLCV
jgi:hypothetical protein